MNADDALQLLIEGNRRFMSGQSIAYQYTQESIADLAVNQKPIAAIVACSDGRVGPDVIFNRPLGSLFVSRVPGNVSSDSTNWMLEIAISNLNVPLIVVLGHTECLAVRQIIEGTNSNQGGVLRFQVAAAVDRAKAKEPANLFECAVRENALHTCERLMEDNWALRSAVKSNAAKLVPAVYDVHTGRVELIKEEIL